MVAILKSLIPKSVKRFIKNEILKTGQVSKPKYAAALKKDECILNGMIAYNKYGGYCVPVSALQESVVQTILKGDVYEPETIQYIIDHCGNGDVIHAGAFFGDFFPGISNKLAPEAQLWTFEPSAEFYKCAKMAILLNELTNVNLFQLGLGEEKTNLRLQVETKDGRTLGGASRIIDGEDGKFVDIKIDTVDAIVPKDRNVSIIQFDLEGFEIPALKGAMETIKRCKPILILEILSHNDIINNSWFTENILSLGYEIAGKVHNNTIIKLKHNS